MFGRWRIGLGHGGQDFQPDPLQIPPPPAVDDQTLRNGGQISPWFDRLYGLPPRKKADENLLGNIGGIGRIAQLAEQPALQPAMMIVIQRGQRR